MMNLNDLMGLITIAIENNKEYSNTWFFDFSGHVNKLGIRYFPLGWDEDDHNIRECCEIKLNENGIQEAYWFIQNRLNR